MNIDYKLLKDHITAPYIATLGPVNPNCITEQLINDLIVSSKTGKIFNYDKDKRWFVDKPEVLVIDKCYQDEKLTKLTTTNKRTKTIAHYMYGNNIASQIKKLQNDIKETDDDQKIVTFDKPNTPYTETAIYFQKFKNTKETNGSSGKTRLFSELDQATQNTLTDLAEDPSNEGFGFLYDQLLSKKITDPVLCFVENKSIVGAIGPLSIGRDINKEKFLNPVYFGVLKDFRRRGVGKSLWLEMCSRAYVNGAKYHLFQADHEAQKFYDSLGIEKVGSKFTVS